MFLSTENPPHDHPLPSPSSRVLHLTASSSHELAQSHPQSFSIRDYAYSNRKKNKIKNHWPFSSKSLHLLSTHGLTDPLPPFETTTASSSSSRKQKIVSHVPLGRDLAKLGLNQTIAKTRRKGALCSQTRTLENGLFTSTSVSKSKEQLVLVAPTSNKRSKTCGRGVGGMVKSKEASSCVGLESVKTCPICKTFSSASNTTLNAHIDQCISVDSPVISKRVNQCLSVDSAVPLVSSSKRNKPRGKPRMKVKTMVDIYATAKRCTLEDLDKRNGTNWAVVSRCTTNRVVVADKSDVSNKKRKVPHVGVGPVYVDAKGQKLRVLTEFSEKKTSTTLMRQQLEDGGNEKKSASQSSKENSKSSRKRRLGKKHHKYLKLNSHKTNEAEIRERQRGFSGEGSSSRGHRRVFNQRMLAKCGSVSKKLNEKGHKVNALQDQQSDDDDSWSGGDHVVLRGTALNKQKLRSEVSGRSKTMFGSKRAKEEKSLAGAHLNTVRLKRSLTSIQEDKYPSRKNVREVSDASPRASSMRKLLPPFVANGWTRRLSLPLELKRARLDFSEEEEEEENGKWESEMTLSDDDSDDNEERNEVVLQRSNPSTFSGYNDYDDDEGSSEEEEEEANNVLDKTDDTGAEFYQSNEIMPSERAMYYTEEVENMVYEEDVRFDSVEGKKGSLYVEVDTIPIPGPPGSFIPSPRGGMSCYDEPLGNSSVITSQLHSSMDHQLDRNSSESPVSAFSNFAAGRLSFPMDVSSSYSTTPVSFSVPSHPEKMAFDKTTTTPSSFRSNDLESCCCQRKERIIISEGVVTLNHQESHLLQRRAAASSSSMAMNLTKPPTCLNPNLPFEQSPYIIQQEFDLHSKFSNRPVVPPSPSNSVLRLMGKDLMVINQGEQADNEEASLSSLRPTPQFLDPPPCAGTGLYLNTGLYLRSSLEATHQPQAHASAFRNNFEHVRYFSRS